MRRKDSIEPHALFRAIWHRHADMVRRMCLRAARGNVERAKDLIQDAAIHLMQACAGMEPGAEAGGERKWVAALTRRSIDHSMRGRSVECVPLEEAGNVAEPPDTGYRETLGELAQNLDHESRAMLAWRLQGYTAEEIAYGTGVTPGAVKSRMHRIIAAMRDQAAAMGYIHNNANDDEPNTQHDNDRERD